ncbi:MAG: hypothetical protein ACKV1O_10240 [Saprospiraceae bacterium]
MKSTFFRPSGLSLLALLLLTALIVLPNIQCNKGQTSYLDFPEHPTPEIPRDVDMNLKAELEQQKKFDDVQRLFDLVSWKAFMALNWPTHPDGKPKAKLSDKGMPVWSSWKESFEVYKPGGVKPLPWGNDRDINEFIRGHNNLAADAKDKSLRVLFRNNKHNEVSDVADESDQAFGGGLWDQNGNLVMYEVLMNETEFNYVVTNTLYNVEGQIEFNKNKNVVSFPAGTYGEEAIGAIEIKVAWKVIDPDKDIASRYLTMEGYIPDPKEYTISTDPKKPACFVVFPENPTYIKATLGMVGMHIAMKTTSSPQWIWATFEQKDNIEADPAVTGKSLSGKTVSLKPSFNDPSCEDCAQNACVEPDANGLRRSQIRRMIPIPPAKKELNAQASKRLAALNSVLQYYELIDTQWPTSPDTPPTPAGNGVASVNNKPGGNVTPVFLTNMTMETYFQIGDQPAYQMEESYGNPKFTAADSVTIFATESCTGCHFSAGIATGAAVDTTKGTLVAISGPPQSADFSWLLQTQAQFVNPRPTEPLKPAKKN